MADSSCVRIGEDDFILSAFVTNDDGGGGRIYTSLQRPRLTFVNEWSRQRGGVQTWMVDGVPVASQDEAEIALKKPPALSDAEREMLGRIRSAWIPRQHLVEEADDGAIGLEMPDHRRAALDGLTRKGLLEWANGMCRRR